MKQKFMFIAMALLFSTAFAKNSQAYTLSCPDFFNITVTGVRQGAEKINVQNYISANWDIAAATDGDCTGKAAKGFQCYQDGQFMINIPMAMFSSTAKTVTVWINGDTDDSDDDDNFRLGTDYTCFVN